MSGKCKISIIGHVGQNPEKRYTPKGQAVTSFSVAVSRKYKRDGEQVQETTWTRITAFGTLAETCAEYVKKGMLIDVEGRFAPDPETGTPRVFQKRDGSWTANYDITASEVQFLSRVESEEREEPREDDIPF